MVSLTYVERKQRIFIARWKKRNKLLECVSQRWQIVFENLICIFFYKRN